MDTPDLSTGAATTHAKKVATLAEAYRRRVAELENLLEDPELSDDAIEAIRSIIEKVVPAPGCAGGEVFATL